MHELLFATGVVETALKHAEGRQVTVVNMRVGRLRQVVPSQSPPGLMKVPMSTL